MWLAERIALVFAGLVLGVSLTHICRPVIGKCKRCQWWADLDLCRGTNARECLCDQNMQDSNTMPGDDGAGDADVGHIWTGPGFGCIHWRQGGDRMIDERT